MAKGFRDIYTPGEGTQVTWGVFKTSVDQDKIPEAEERAALRERAARDLTNIDDEERARRGVAGSVLAVVTVAVGAGLLASHSPPLTRLSIAPLLFLSYGFTASSREGL